MLAILLPIYLNAMAQPANDNPCGAIALPVIENADPCTLTSYNIAGATWLNLAVPQGCNNSSLQYPDVWYTFSTSKSNISIKVGCGISYQLYSTTSCSGTFSMLTDCKGCADGGGEIFYDVTPGSIYYLRVNQNATGGNFSFSLCINTNQVASNHRVGINTLLPTENLDVAGTVKFRNTVKFNNGFNLTANAGTNKVLASDASGNANWNDLNALSGQWSFSSDNIYNTNSGNTGIGINLPLHKLHVGNGTTRIEGPSVAGGVALALGGFGDIQVDRPGVSAGRFVVKEGGDVGVGIAIPSPYGHGGTNRILQVHNPIQGFLFGNSQSHLILSSVGQNGSQGGITWVATGLGGEQRTALIASQFEAAGQTRLVFYTRNSAGALVQHLSIGSNGNATLTGTLTQNSDARMKTNIQPLSSVLSQLRRLNGYSYNWINKSRDSEEQIGLLAQEVQKVYPQLVKQNDKGELSVNYMGIVPLLIEAIKEQDKKIEALQQMVETIRDKK